MIADVRVDTVAVSGEGVTVARGLDAVGTDLGILSTGTVDVQAAVFTDGDTWDVVSRIENERVQVRDQAVKEEEWCQGQLSSSTMVGHTCSPDLSASRPGSGCQSS